MRKTILTTGLTAGLVLGIILGAGGATVKALSKDTVIEYLAQKPGYTTAIDDGRLWVFAGHETPSTPEKHITLIGAGPLGSTLKAVDRDTALVYLASKAGFQVSVDDGRLWVHKAGEDAAMPEKHVTLVGAGPRGMTIKAADRATAVQYLASKPGFSVKEDEDGRLWVFRGDEPGEQPEKHVTRVGAGPMGKTLKAIDRDTMIAYLAAR